MDIAPLRRRAGSAVTLTVTVTLQAGGDTLLLFNNSGWAPDFDRIVV